LNKRGFIGEKQRYLCKVCGMNFREGDGRKRHPEGIKREQPCGNFNFLHF
jgi:transposase-like protein